MNKYVVIAIYGKTGSGKTTLINKLFSSMSKENEKYYHKIISFTTRPKRNNEIDGNDAFFISNEDFNKKDCFEKVVFKENWQYGTTLDRLNKDKINIGVFDIKRITQMQKQQDLIVYPVLVECDSDLRLIRDMRRNQGTDYEEILRRFAAEDTYIWDSIKPAFVIQNSANIETAVSAFLNNLNILFKKV